MKLLRNRARCTDCGDVIESKYGYDFVQCSCLNLAGDTPSSTGIFIDGGLNYQRIGFARKESFEDLSEWAEDEEKVAAPPPIL